MTRDPAGHETQMVHNLRRCVLWIQFGLLALVVAVAPQTPLSFAWTSLGPTLALLVPCLIGWVYYHRWPGSPREASYPATLSAIALLLTLGCIVGPGQYVMVALRRPLVDPWLASMDASMGVSVPALVAWIRTSPELVYVARFAYVTLLAQFFFSVLVLGFLLHDHNAVWEYVFHFHICAAITLTCLAFFPAVGVYDYHQTPALIELDRFHRHFATLQSGAPMVVRFDDVEGLVSFPSFHVAGAWMVTWAFRRYGLICAVVIVLNLAMTAATIFLGLHYAVDLLATALMCAISVSLYRLAIKTIPQPSSPPSGYFRANEY